MTDQSFLSEKDVSLNWILSMLKQKDQDTANHSQRVGLYAFKLAERIGYEDPEELRVKGLGHDIGKLNMSDKTLKGDNHLKSWQIAEKNRHSEDSGVIAESIGLEGFDIMCHHAHWDGRGKPSGLKGENIPIPSRILAIADVFDALVSKRSYKEPYTYSEAKKWMLSESGKYFDPKLLEIFFEMMDETIDRYVTEQSVNKGRGRYSGKEKITHIDIAGGMKLDLTVKNKKRR